MSAKKEIAAEQRPLVARGVSPCRYPHLCCVHIGLVFRPEADTTFAGGVNPRNHGVSELCPTLQLGGFAAKLQRGASVFCVGNPGAYAPGWGCAALRAGAYVGFHQIFGPKMWVTTRASAPGWECSTQHSHFPAQIAAAGGNLCRKMRTVVLSIKSQG